MKKINRIIQSYDELAAKKRALEAELQEYKKQLISLSEGKPSIETDCYTLKIHSSTKRKWNDESISRLQPKLADQFDNMFIPTFRVSQKEVNQFQLSSASATLKNALNRCITSETTYHSIEVKKK